MDAFSPEFREDLHRLMLWRRDVRRFRTDPVPEEILARGLDAFSRAPSVGLSEPWRVINVESAAARAAALSNFQTANAEALAAYQAGGDIDRATLYAGLKLSGMQKAPVQLAVFCDTGTVKGAGLGARSMPEMRAYSVVAAMTMMWLALRAEGVGMGWVSILDPEALAKSLDVPESWKLIGYLCIGWPERSQPTPELEQLGWETRDGLPKLERR
ncbi:5,6-dimethylbenzimidazole synthase [Thioclava sp. GXIMD4216]|uniref:5,6-dimethylbenzimidazole synthase n=1 Tax=Thioclava litoralis TaxID=3076557 RepID=A0ABZ1E1P6_9RHOB|nr:5,6-dimethylbenzimidazole synthase [Thioclava sp. FTW29]